MYNINIVKERKELITMNITTGIAILITLFIITAIVISLVVHSAYDLKPILSAFIGLCGSLIIALIFIGSTCIEDLSDDVVWNDGKCPNCQVEWEFENVNSDSKFIYSTTLKANVSHSRTHYYYKCPKCGKVIETNFLMK